MKFHDYNNIMPQCKTLSIKENSQFISILNFPDNYQHNEYFNFITSATDIKYGRSIEWLKDGAFESGEWHKCWNEQHNKPNDDQQEI